MAARKTPGTRTKGGLACIEPDATSLRLRGRNVATSAFHKYALAASIVLEVLWVAALVAMALAE